MLGYHENKTMWGTSESGGGLPPLDFGAIRGGKRKAYFSAVQAGMDRTYEPMEIIFSAVVRRTLRLHGKQLWG